MMMEDDDNESTKNIRRKNSMSESYPNNGLSVIVTQDVKQPVKDTPNKVGQEVAEDKVGRNITSEISMRQSTNKDDPPEGYQFPGMMPQPRNVMNEDDSVQLGVVQFWKTYSQRKHKCKEKGGCTCFEGVGRVF